jgi:spermidine synthase
VLDYQQDILGIAESLASFQRALFLGGGSFTMPRAVKARFPAAEVEAVEIDPDVVWAARKYLELDERVNVVIDDGRHALEGREGRYDLIVNDAFHGVRNIPFHLLTREFHRRVALKLSPEGIYAVNVIGHRRRSRLVQSVTRTLTQEFTHVRHFAPSKGQAQNVWILASQQQHAGLGQVSAVDKSLGRVLTDGDAPVEYLIALDMMGRN